MFNISKNQARQFFITTWDKFKSGKILTPEESIASQIINDHPEYQSLINKIILETKRNNFNLSSFETNMFLHFSMHLAIQEQISINQPTGIAEIFKKLCLNNSKHHSAHKIMGCLEKILNDAYKERILPNNDAYLEILKKLL